MGLLKEPKGVDFIIKSEPWTDQELADFRKLMEREKAKNKGKADTDKDNQKDSSKA